MSRRNTEDIPHKLKEFYEKVSKCRYTVKNWNTNQIDHKCPCDSNSFIELCCEIENCKTTLTTLNQLWMPLENCVEGLLSKAQRLIVECKPKECDKTCLESCAKVGRWSKACLVLSRECALKPEFLRVLKKLLKEVCVSPRLVICRCYTHLNTQTLQLYLRLAHFVVLSLVEPLSTEGNYSPQETKNILLEEGSIHIAALKGNIREASAAIQNGKNVNGFDEKRLTALHIATILKDMAMVTKLLDYGADPYIPEQNYYSPLLLATITQQKAMVEMMSCKEMNPNQDLVQFFCSILVALSLKDKDMLEILVSKHTALNEYVNSIRMDKESEIVDQSENINDVPEHRPGTSGGNENGSNCIFVNEKKRHGGSEAEERTGRGDGTIADETADLLKPLTFRE